MGGDASLGRCTVFLDVVSERDEVVCAKLNISFVLVDSSWVQESVNRDREGREDRRTVKEKDREWQQSRGLTETLR